MKNIMILDREDFNNYYGQELLANLESCPQIKFGNTLNFVTKTVFDGTQGSRVIDAFNIYLRNLSSSVERIIINL